MPTRREQFRLVLRAKAKDFGITLEDQHLDQLGDYYEILLKWNERLHLVAPCAPEEFATRHVLESLLLLAHLRADASMVDVGSGGGLPAIPCLIVRRDLRATLIESSKRKAVFLREALLRTATSSQAKVIAERFQEVSPLEASFVSARALDKFPLILEELIAWSPPRSTLLIFAGRTLRDRIERLMREIKVEKIPESDSRFLVVARRD